MVQTLKSSFNEQTVNENNRYFMEYVLTGSIQLSQMGDYLKMVIKMIYLNKLTKKQTACCV